MSRRAMEGTCLAALVRMAVAVCRAAEKQCPRSGPGRPPQYEDWQIAALIMVAILARRKSKSAQYRFLFHRRRELQRLMDLDHLPCRATYFARYRRVSELLATGVRVQGNRAIRQRIADARVVAVDKSVIQARGPAWNRGDRRRGIVRKGLRGVDRDSTWTYCEYRGWVQGYSYEVLVSAGRDGLVVPLLASADTASASEHTTFGPKIAHLSPETKAVLADRGYDNSRYTDAIEYDRAGRRTGRRFVCPGYQRNTRRAKQPWHQTRQAAAAQLKRHRRMAFAASPAGRRLLARRGQTVEPFNEWFKHLFELNDHVWHYGLANNRTQILAAICCYQLLVRYNHRCHRPNGQIQWILDRL